MPYNPNIPQANDQLSISQNDILQNFQALNSVFNASNFLSLPSIVSSPNPDATHMAMYVQQSALTNQPEFFMQRNNGFISGTSPVQFTAMSPQANGWSYLPSGVLLKWGLDTCPGNSVATITFPTGAQIPVFTTIFTIQVTTRNADNGSPNQLITVGNWNNLNFDVFNRQLIGFSSTQQFSYLAIGN